MKIYIDNDFKCYTAPADGLRPVETDFFDGKCKALIEGYRYVPEGETWTRSDGVQFSGEMISPWKPYQELEAAQLGYEEALSAQPDVEALRLENADMQSALNVLGVTVNG